MAKHRWLRWLMLAGLALLLAACGCAGGDDDDDHGADDDVGDDDTTDDDTVDDDTADDDTTDDDTTDDDTVDDDTPSAADPFIEEGKKYLRLGAGDLANEQFQLGMEADPPHEDCWYGIVLSDTLRDFDVVSIIDAYVEMILGYQPPSALDIPQTGQGFIDALVDAALDGLLIEKSDELIEQAERLRAEHPDVDFELDRMPIILNFEEIADVHGEFDLAEGIAAESIARQLSGLTQHATALNLDFNLGLIWEIADINWGSLPFEEMLGLIVDYGLLLLDDPIFPDFLTLKDDAEPYRAAGLELGLGFLNAKETYETMIAETGGETDEVLGYDDPDGDGVWQEGEHLIVPPWGILDDAQNQQAWAFRDVFSHLADSFLDYTDYDTDPDNPQPFKLAYLNPLLESFGLPGLFPDIPLFQIDFGASYRDADPTQVKDTLVLILKLLDMFLP